MANLSSIAGEDLYNETSYPTTKVGSRGMDSFGNVYRYIYNGGVALTTGNLLQEPAEDTNYNNMAVPAIVAIGATTIGVTLGGTAVTANQFSGGQLFVSYSTGIGQNFRIISHDVQTSTTGLCNFVVDRPVKIALATTSKVTVRKNKFNGVIQSPITTSTGGVVGVALYANTINYYGWIQSGGDTACLADTGTNFASSDSGVARSLAVAGCVKPADGSEGGEIIGVTNNVTSTDSYMLSVNLFLN